MPACASQMTVMSAPIDGLVIRGNRVLCADGVVREASIFITEGKITRFYHDRNVASPYAGFEEIDAGDLLVSPGIVDCHVHVNEPGRTEWEGYTSATKAAAAGGVTTLIDMPLNSVPSTTSLEAFEIKIERANKVDKYIDVGFWGGVVPGNKDSLDAMIERGVAGFKCFMVHSGVDDFPHVSEDDIVEAMSVLKDSGVPLLFHAEVDIENNNTEVEGDVRNHETFLKTRPDQMEVEAIKLVIWLCREHRVPCHIVHLATAEALPMIRAAKEEGLPLTVETTTHYLTFNSEGVPDGATQYKCCPPIRTSRNQSLLWDAVMDGTIDMVISDHSPCTTDLKLQDKGDFLKAWGGVASIQFDLCLFWDGLKKRGGCYKDLLEKMCVNTAKLCGMDHRKGHLLEGYDADVIIWDPYSTVTIKEEHIYHKNKLTPYMDKEYYGKVHKTIVGGKLVYDEDKFTHVPQGALLFRC